MNVLLPGLKALIGYANGIGPKADRCRRPGRLERAADLRVRDIVPQFRQALLNILAVLKEAGGEARHICRMTAYCCDKPAYMAARRQLGAIWRELIGNHYPAMSMIFVVDLLDNPGKIELEATAVLPRR
jgi:enamine deaminase RidA (YjgF/YER057c/UK114 family)